LRIPSAAPPPKRSDYYPVSGLSFPRRLNARVCVCVCVAFVPRMVQWPLCLSGGVVQPPAIPSTCAPLPGCALPRTLRQTAFNSSRWRQAGKGERAGRAATTGGKGDGGAPATLPLLLRGSLVRWTALVVRVGLFLPALCASSPIWCFISPTASALSVYYLSLLKRSLVCTGWVLLLLHTTPSACWPLLPPTCCACLHASSIRSHFGHAMSSGGGKHSRRGKVDDAIRIERAWAFSDSAVLLKAGCSPGMSYCAMRKAAPWKTGPRGEISSLRVAGRWGLCHRGGPDVLGPLQGAECFGAAGWTFGAVTALGTPSLPSCFCLAEAEFMACMATLLLCLIL